MRFTYLFLLVAVLRGQESEPPQLVIEPQGHSAIVRKIRFTPDGKRLISISDDKTIRVWDTGDGTLRRTIRGQIGDGPVGKLFAMALSPDGRILAVGGYGNDSESHAIRLFQLETGNQIGLLENHKNTILSLAFSSGGDLLASGSADRTIKLWKIPVFKKRWRDNDPHLLATLEGHEDSIYALAFSPDGKKLVSGSNDHSLRLWCHDSEEAWALPPVMMKRHTANVMEVTFAPNDGYILSGDLNGQILVWDGEGTFVRELTKLGGRVDALAFSSTGKRLAAGGDDFKVSLFDFPSGERSLTFTKHTNTIYDVAFFGDDLVASIGGNNHEIYLWKPSDGEALYHLTGQSRCLWSVAFGPGTTVAFGFDLIKKSDNHCGPLQKSFDFAALTPLWPGDFRDFQRAVTTSHGQNLVKTGDFTLNIDAGTVIANSKQADGRIRCFSFANDGQIVVGSDSSLKLYGADGHFLRNFAGHLGPIWALAPSPDGNLLASASWDQTVRLWSLANGELLATLFWARDGEWVCWNPKGYYAASPGGEKYIGWHINCGWDKEADYYPAYSYRRHFHRSELLRRTVELHSFTKAWSELSDIDNWWHTPPPAPKINWLAPDSAESVVTTASIQIVARIRSETPVNEVKLLVNGGTRAAETIRRDGDPSSFRLSAKVTLKPGTNIITLFASNRDADITSKPRTVILRAPEIPKRHLYVLAIGIAEHSDSREKLNYPDDDARLLTGLFGGQRGRLFSEVTTRLLVDDQATREGILQGLDWLRNQVTFNDLAVVFVAGHGYLQDDKFYLLPYDGRRDKLMFSAVDMSHFSSVLRNLPTAALMFLDTCHAGRLANDFRERGFFDNSEFLRELASQEGGVAVLAGSTGKELAIEREEWGHGAFTQALKEALDQGKADSDGDGIVHLNELGTYVARRVQELNKDQRPIMVASPQIDPTVFPIYQLAR